MIELVIAACLVDQPGRCQHFTLNFEGQSVSVRQCGFNGQLGMAQWAGEHPNWVIKDWTCGIAGQTAKL